MLPLVVSMQTLGALKAQVVAVKDDVHVERVVVLLHGYGAPGDDLVPLARELGVARGTRFVFPEAPIDLGQGRAWWMLDWNARGAAERSGDWSAYEKVVPDGVVAARKAVESLLAAIARGWHPARLVLGGFSQGAMLSVDVAANLSVKPKALIVLSGAMFAAPDWLPHAKSLAGVPVFMSHGEHDTTLPFVTAERLRDALGAAGANVAWLPFSGGHAIPPEVSVALREFLN